MLHLPRNLGLEAPAADTQILRACAVEVHMNDVERHECAVNSNELAVHGRAPQRSKHQLPFPYRKNPSVCPHCLEKNNHYIEPFIAKKNVFFWISGNDHFYIKKLYTKAFIPIF